jgi:Fe2+ transport system protein FeoA
MTSANTTTEAPLSTLAVGQKGRIAGFDLPADQKGRLFEMGLTSGAEVEVIRFAPLGDPIDIKVRGYHLSLRKREAAGIRIAIAMPPQQP